jgi:uncharacterized protein (DUF849 family)
MAEIYEALDTFRALKKELSIDDQSLSILTAALLLRNDLSSENLGHEICLAIRNGLFGHNASDMTTIMDLRPSE